MSIAVGGIFGLIWLILVIWAIIKIAGSSASSLSKAIWIVVLWVFPFIGFIIWFFIGPKSNT